MACRLTCGVSIHIQLMYVRLHAVCRLTCCVLGDMLGVGGHTGVSMDIYTCMSIDMLCVGLHDVYWLSCYLSTKGYS